VVAQVQRVEHRPTDCCGDPQRDVVDDDERGSGERAQGQVHGADILGEVLVVGAEHRQPTHAQAGKVVVPVQRSEVRPSADEPPRDGEQGQTSTMQPSDEHGFDTNERIPTELGQLPFVFMGQCPY
jgi:hypothetical protein